MPAREEMSYASSEGSPKQKVEVTVTTAAFGAAVAAVNVALETAIAPDATSALSPDHAPVVPKVAAVSLIQSPSASVTAAPCTSGTSFV